MLAPASPVLPAVQRKADRDVTEPFLSRNSVGRGDLRSYGDCQGAGVVARGEAGGNHGGGGAGEGRDAL